MFAIFGVLIAGVCVGIFLRRFPNITVIGKLITVFIFLLLFFLGKSVGMNDAIISNLSTLGIQALMITIAAVAGSVIMSWVVYKRFFEVKEEEKDISNSSSEDLANKPA